MALHSYQTESLETLQVSHLVSTGPLLRGVHSSKWENTGMYFFPRSVRLGRRLEVQTQIWAGSALVPREEEGQARVWIYVVCLFVFVFYRVPANPSQYGTLYVAKIF